MIAGIDRRPLMHGAAPVADSVKSVSRSDASRLACAHQRRAEYLKTLLIAAISSHSYLRALLVATALASAGIAVAIR